jgi:hypothetical protein
MQKDKQERDVDIPRELGCRRHSDFPPTEGDTGQCPEVKFFTPHHPIKFLFTTPPNFYFPLSLSTIKLIYRFFTCLNQFAASFRHFTDSVSNFFHSERHF